MLQILFTMMQAIVYNLKYLNDMKQGLDETYNTFHTYAQEWNKANIGERLDDQSESDYNAVSEQLYNEYDSVFGRKFEELANRRKYNDECIKKCEHVIGILQQISDYVSHKETKKVLKEVKLLQKIVKRFDMIIVVIAFAESLKVSYNAYITFCNANAKNEVEDLTKYLEENHSVLDSIDTILHNIKQSVDTQTKKLQQHGKLVGKCMCVYHKITDYDIVIQSLTNLLAIPAIITYY